MLFVFQIFSVPMMTNVYNMESTCCKFQTCFLTPPHRCFVANENKTPVCPDVCANSFCVESTLFHMFYLERQALSNHARRHSVRLSFISPNRGLGVQPVTHSNFSAVSFSGVELTCLWGFISFTAS